MQYEKLKKLAEKVEIAFPGSWYSDDYNPTNDRYVFRDYYGRFMSMSYASESVDSETRIEKEMAVGDYIVECSPNKILELLSENERLCKEVEEWKNNHATEVNRARLLKERKDMPVERIAAYNRIGELETDIENYKKTIEQLESKIVANSSMQDWRINEILSRVISIYESSKKADHFISSVSNAMRKFQ